LQLLFLFHLLSWRFFQFKWTLFKINWFNRMLTNPIRFLWNSLILFNNHITLNQSTFNIFRLLYKIVYLFSFNRWITFFLVSNINCAKLLLLSIKIWIRNSKSPAILISNLLLYNFFQLWNDVIHLFQLKWIFLILYLFE
jgi:hypothetical protein